MRRRDFIKVVAGSAITWPLAARAQQSERMRRIGVLMGYPENYLEGPAFFAAFREGLQKLGWMEDRNIRLDTRWVSPEDAEARQRFAKQFATDSVALYNQNEGGGPKTVFRDGDPP